MSVTVSLGVSIFLFGAAFGALLTRLQWMAFKQKVSQEMTEQFGGGRSSECRPTKVGRPHQATLIAPYLKDSQRALAASPVVKHISSEIVADAALKRLLEEHQMEIAGILREVQASWDAIGLLEKRPEPSKVFAQIVQMTDQACKSTTYAGSVR